MNENLAAEHAELYAELEKKREHYHEQAKIKRLQVVRAFQEYSKLLSQHNYLVNAHDKIDRKMFLLTPGITFLKAHKPKAEKKPAVKREKKHTIADALGNNGVEDMLKALIAKKQREEQMEKNVGSDAK